MPDLLEGPVIVAVGLDHEHLPQLAAYAHARILFLDDLFEFKPEIPPMPRSLPPGGDPEAPERTASPLAEGEVVMRKHLRTRPKVRLHKGGHVTLSGIDYNDLRSILTAARLYRYDHPAKEDDAPDYKAWHVRMAYLLDELGREVEARINETFPWHGRSLNKAQRWNVVREQREFRKTMDELFAQMKAGAPAKPYAHTYKTCDCGDGHCMICGGGLSFCTTCGGAEGSLTTDCCGRPITELETYLIYDLGLLDFINGQWVLNAREE